MFFSFRSTLQKQNTEISKQIFPEKEYPNFHIHVSVRDLYIPTISLPILLEEICTVDRSWDYINRSQTQDVEIGAEAALFLEKEYISGIFVAVQLQPAYVS
jgi:hypothetical protein